MNASLNTVINPLAPGGIDYSLKLVNFKLVSLIDILSIFCEIAIRWMPQHLTDHWSTLVQVMAWCHQATSHYLSQCWPKSLLPYDVTKSKWVKLKLSKMYSMTDLAIHRLKFVWQSINICIFALHSVIIIIITLVGKYWTMDLMHRLVVSAFYQKVGQFLFGRWTAISWRFATILYYFSLYVFAAALIQHCTSYPTPTHHYYIVKWSYL